MNVVAKASIVVVLILSILFMAFAMAVYATHRNWKDLAQQRETELQKVRSDNAQLQTQIEQHKNRLAHEQAARRHALSRLETQVQEKGQEVESRNQQLHELQANQRAATDAVVNAQRQLDQLKEQITAMADEVRKARTDRDQQFGKVRDLTDQMHQMEGVRVRLEERSKQLTEELTRATSVLEAHSLSVNTPVDDAPPAARGQVLSVRTDMIEISLGEDDGMRPGHTVVVSRRDKFLGRAEITRVSPDRSVGRIQYRNAPIQEGDRVQTKTEIR